MINLRVSLLALALLGSTGWANAQSIAEDIVMDQHAPVDEPLEKAIDYFTATDFPSVMVGNGRGGIYLYRSTSGQLEGP
jgi:hypothetical protein